MRHLIFLCDLNVCFDFHLFSPHALLTVSRIFFPLICKKGLTIRTYAAQTVGSLLLIILHVVCSTLNTVSRITNPFYHAGVFCARGKETRTIPGLTPVCRQTPWRGAALASNPLAWHRSAAGLPGVAPLCLRTYWLGTGLPPDSLAWCCFGIEPTGLAPVCRRTPWRGAEPAGLMRTCWLGTATPLLPGWLPLLLGWIRFPL